MCPVSIINSPLMILLFSNSAARWHHLGSFDINRYPNPWDCDLNGSYLLRVFKSPMCSHNWEHWSTTKKPSWRWLGISSVSTLKGQQTYTWVRSLTSSVNTTETVSGEEKQMQDSAPSIWCPLNRHWFMAHGLPLLTFFTATVTTMWITCARL